MSTRSIRSGYAQFQSQAGGAALRHEATGRAARQALLLGTALGCSIAVFSLAAPQQAWATNECGSVTTVSGVDVATCAPGTYPSGITYTDSSGNPIVITLGSGADPTGAGGVFVENTAPGAYAGIVIDAGSDINVFATPAAAVYTTGGGTAYVKNYGQAWGGIYADAIGGGKVYVSNAGDVLSSGNMIKAKSSGGNVEVYSVYLGESTTYSGTTNAINLYAVNGTGDTVSNGGIALTSQNGYAVGITSAATLDNSTRIYGNVDVQGYSGAMGVKTSSANRAYTTIYGDVNVSSGWNGGGGGNATGIITVGSDVASTYVEGGVTVTAVNGVALGVESSSFNGSYVTVGGVTATGDLGATAVYDRTIYDHNAGVFVGGDVGAYSSQGSAIGVFAEAGNVVANDATSTNVTVTGNVNVSGAAGAWGVIAENYAGTVSVDVFGNVKATATNGSAVGIESIEFGAYDNTVTVDGSVYAKGGSGAYGVIAEGGNIYVGIAGDVTAIAAAGNAIGVFSYGDNTVHIGGDVSITASGNAIGVKLGGADGDGYVGGNISVTSTGAGNAEGMYGNATGDVTEHVGGNVYAKAASGLAVGLVAESSTGNATVYVGGDVYAGSATGAAGGVIAYGGGVSDVTVEGSVVARGNSTAIGAAIVGYGNIHVGGDVGAYASDGNATGVEIATGGGYAFVGGNVTAVTGGSGYNAEGFYGNVTGDISAHIDGNVYAKATDGLAVGVLGESSTGNVTLYVGGDIYAKSASGEAAGAVAYGAGGYANITIEGNVAAHGNFIAIGAGLVGYGNIHIGGDVGAYASDGNATGVTIQTGGGYAFVGGNVVAITGGSSYNAEGFYGNVTGDISAHIDGNVYAKATDGLAVGVLAQSTAGNVTLYVGGDIYAKSATGEAAGAVGGGAGGYANVTVEGNIVARGDSLAIGAGVAGYGNIHVGGDVGAYASDGNATGVTIQGGGGYAYVHGNVAAITGGSGYNAEGFYGNVTGDVSAHIDGSVYAKATDGLAVGVLAQSTAGNVTLYV
ncbi:MAG TPA: hypothetical protein VG407_03440, partial [Caulobacteraceae bacterium]|nr:hypothetical protein [Caulobacteraceae bacterium]